ncbi:MAG: hypothetical protein AB1656_16860 [Candidatus Omnitrophota bacterium]
MIRSSGATKQVYDLLLTNSERSLILDKASLSDEMDKKIRFAAPSDGQTVIRLPLDDLDELAGCIAIEANHCQDKRIKKRWDKIFSKIQDILDEQFAEEHSPPKGEQSLKDELAYQDLSRIFPPETAKAIVDLLRSGQCKDEDEFKQRVGEIIDAQNRKPLPEAGGLSPHQVYLLIHADWDSPDGPIRFNDDLRLEDLQDAPIFQDARLLLSAIQEEGGNVKATSSGNLNRQFVSQMLERLDLPPEFLDDLHRYNKVINERDVFPLHIPRLLLTFSGILRKSKSIFNITHKGKKYLADDQAGKLYLKLFIAHFHKFNLAYRDRLAPNEPLQHTIAYSLWRIPQEAKDWIDTDELAPKIVLPIVREHAPVYEFFDHFYSQISSRILYSLKDFGLLERREIPTDDKNIFTYDVRMTPLYDKFIHFHIP